MSDNDPRDIDVPSVVASIKDPDKYTAFDTMLEAAHFFDTLEAIRTRSGKSKEEFLIVIKPNFMMTIRIENPLVVYTDPELVEHWVKKLREAEYTLLRVVEAQNVYSLWYKNRSVNHVARVVGLTGDGYEVRDLTNEQFPFDYGGDLGQLRPPSRPSHTFRFISGRSTRHGASTDLLGTRKVSMS